MTPLKPMLAKDVDWAKLRFPVAVQPKIDGIRVHVQGGVALTRTLKRVPNAEIQAALGRPEFEGLDGEVIVGDPTSESCYRDTTSFVMSSSKRGESWTFMVFDDIQAAGHSYRGRRVLLEDRSKGLGPDGSWGTWPANVVLVAEMVADTVEQIETVEELMVTEGYEGVILRTLDAPYKHGRSTPAGPLLKVKRFIDFEAVVVGVYEEQHNGNERFENELGRGARSSAKAGKTGKGTLGGLVVRALNGPAAGVEFRVGTGFDAVQRADYWRDDRWGMDEAHKHHRLVGAVAKIKSFPIGVKDKPRHPVFLGWRDLRLDG